MGLLTAQITFDLPTRWAISEFLRKLIVVWTLTAVDKAGTLDSHGGADRAAGNSHFLSLPRRNLGQGTRYSSSLSHRSVDWVVVGPSLSGAEMAGHLGPFQWGRRVARWVRERDRDLGTALNLIGPGTPSGFAHRPDQIERRQHRQALYQFP